MGHQTRVKNAGRDGPEPRGSCEAPASAAIRREIHHAENLTFLRANPTAEFALIYIDPPFNTGKTRTRETTRAVRDDGNDRSGRAYTGFGGVRYRRVEIDGGAADGSSRAYGDTFEDYLGFLEPRLTEARRVLEDDGSIFVHVDPRESHYVKVLMDDIFGRDSFMNEIIWAYDYGGRPKRRWPAKHDVILWYAKDPKRYTFNYDAIDRIPYMAPELVGPEKAARGKTPTDVWWHTIVSPTGKEKTGYPTQKPRGILERIIGVHSNAGDVVLDFFAGSGTTGEAAARLGRGFVLVDETVEAVEVIEQRLGMGRFA